MYAFLGGLIAYYLERKKGNKKEAPNFHFHLWVQLLHQYSSSSRCKWTYWGSHADIFMSFFHNLCWYVSSSCLFYNFRLQFSTLNMQFSSSLLDKFIKSWIHLLTGAGWWAQEFGKSIPIFSWVPIFHGKILNLLPMKFFYIVYTPSAVLTMNIHPPSLPLCNSLWPVFIVSSG